MVFLSVNRTSQHPQFSFPVPLYELTSRNEPTTISIPSFCAWANFWTLCGSARMAMWWNFDFYFRNSCTRGTSESPLAPMRSTEGCMMSANSANDSIYKTGEYSYVRGRCKTTLLLRKFLQKRLDNATHGISWRIIEWRLLFKPYDVTDTSTRFWDYLSRYL